MVGGWWVDGGWMMGGWWVDDGWMMGGSSSWQIDTRRFFVLTFFLIILIIVSIS